MTLLIVGIQILSDNSPSSTALGFAVNSFDVVGAIFQFLGEYEKIFLPVQDIDVGKIVFKH
jgi:hypothetical protein